MTGYDDRNVYKVWKGASGIIAKITNPRTIQI